jgi:SAM-dependent methyltransferase
MTNCPVCRSSNTQSVASFRHKTAIFTGCSRAVCADCEMVFASPMPSEDMLSDYNASYFATAHGGQPTSRPVIAFSSGIARLRLAFLKRFLDKYHIGIERVLELGPGPGFFARSCLEGWPQSVYSAVETDNSCHDSLRNLGVQLVESPAVVHSDLVIMSHVLEHVPDPVTFVLGATQGLKPGGALFIEVPCRDWEHKALDEPHILFFDKEPMRRLLTGLGFVDIEVTYYGQQISQLQSTLPLRTKMMAIRAKLISWGLVAPFAKTQPGMETLVDALERAMVAPYMAHKESTEPAWWLRAVARKA